MVNIHRKGESSHQKSQYKLSEKSMEIVVIVIIEKTRYYHCECMHKDIDRLHSNSSQSNNLIKLFGSIPTTIQLALVQS